MTTSGGTTSAPSATSAILLVEDNPTARKMFRLTLETEGYRILEAGDVRSALDHLAREIPALVLQDLVLPDRDGVELARAMRQCPGGAELRIVVMSGFPRLLDRARVDNKCFDASLMKPVSPSVLVDLVRRYVPAPAPPAQELGRGLSLLVVDDDPIQLKLTRLRFESVGFEVVTASCAADALMMARVRPPDVVLCDVLMPDTDGYELTAAIRADPLLTRVPVVLVSAHFGGSRDEELARLSGASRLVVRTPTMESAIDAVRHALHHEGAGLGSPEFERQHADRVIAQLRRQARVDADAAERAALQSAQLSVLAGIADAIARSEDIDEALSDILSSCLDAGGVSRGALFRLDALDHQTLSVALGFPPETLPGVRNLFGFPQLLAAGDRSMLTPRDVLSAEDAQLFLEKAGVTFAMVVPIAEGTHRVGLLFLGTDLPDASEHDLSTFGRAIAAHIGQALALTGAFRRLRASADASRILSASLDVGTTLRALGDLATAELAHVCEICIGGEPPFVRHAKALPQDVADALRLLQTRHAGRRLMSTDATAPPGQRWVLVPSVSDDALVSLARDPGHLGLLRAVGIGSYVVVPLVAGEHHLGTVAFARLRGARQFRDVDLMSVEDLAQRAAMAIDKARLYAAGQDANRAKDEFLATVSHELRTPLNAILGWAQLLGSGLASEKRQLAMAAIVRNALAQTALVDDLLDMSRIVSGTMRLEIEVVELASLIDSALQSLRPQLEAKELRVGWARGAGHASLMGDPNRLQQIACNLVNNAIKFTPPRGRIELALSETVDTVTLTVQDSGKGIEPAFLPHVFDRFKQEDGTTSRQHGGLGLGLAIVRHLVELHAGTIRAESEGSGKGARFVVTLPKNTEPLVDAPAPAVPDAMSKEQQRLVGVDVLVVDDEAENVDMMVELLAQWGASARSALSAAEALTRIAEQRPDILISDLGMPGEDGYALIRSVRALPKSDGGGIPAVACSGYASGDDRKRAIAAGFQTHIAKPVRVAELLETLTSLARAPS